MKSKYLISIILTLTIMFSIELVIAPIGDWENPNVYINSPLDQTYLTNDIFFNITATDNFDVSDCWFTLNENPTTYPLTRINPFPENDWTTTKTLSSGSYLARFYCTDAPPYDNFNDSETVSFSIEVSEPTGPEIILVSPPQGSADTDGVLDFIFIPSDTDNIESCSLICQGETYTTIDNILNNEENIIEVVSVEGQHALVTDDLRWSIKCIDEDGYTSYS